MGKVAVVVCPNIRNFGSVLQSYATQMAVTKLGYDNEYIDYTKTKADSYKYLIQLFIPSIMAERRSFKKRKSFQKNHAEEFAQRNEAFDTFVHKYMTASPKYIGYKMLKKFSSNYDMAVLGSDQVWNPINSGSDFYTLNWLPSSTKRIAYASSFGVSKIPFLLKGFYKNFLSKFDYISVREINGVNIVKDLVNKNVKCVCDPTMLFDSSEWDNVIEDKPVVEGEYIFCYFLGNRAEPRESAIKLSRLTGHRIVMMPYFGEISEFDKKIKADIINNPGPSDFLNAIKYAKFVCTDSFHGSVFSILYQKEFWVFRRHNLGSNKDTFSRLESLLKLLNLEDRVENYLEINDEGNIKKINYVSVMAEVEKLREESWAYLKDSLEK